MQAMNTELLKQYFAKGEKEFARIELIVLIMFLPSNLLEWSFSKTHFRKSEYEAWCYLELSPNYFDFALPLVKNFKAHPNIVIYKLCTLITTTCTLFYF